MCISDSIKGVLPVLIIMTVLSLAARLAGYGSVLGGLVGIFIIVMLPIGVLTSYVLWKKEMCIRDRKYTGKTVKFLAQVCQTNRAGKNSFVPGRFAMTCCVQDIQFVGMPCKYDDYKSLEQRSWITITAKINVKYHPCLLYTSSMYSRLME